MVGWCDFDHVALPRNETQWSKALTTALLKKEMILGEVRNATGIGVVRLSSLKNGQDQPTEDEREALEGLLGFSV